MLIHPFTFFSLFIYNYVSKAVKEDFDFILHVLEVIDRPCGCLYPQSIFVHLIPYLQVEDSGWISRQASPFGQFGRFLWNFNFFLMTSFTCKLHLDDDTSTDFLCHIKATKDTFHFKTEEFLWYLIFFNLSLDESNRLFRSFKACSFDLGVKSASSFNFSSRTRMDSSWSTHDIMTQQTACAQTCT